MSSAIPRRFHWIWLGSEPLPAEYRHWMDGWLSEHREWSGALWTDANRPLLRNEETFNAAAEPAQRADILRYELVAGRGGVYLDCDMECLRNVEPLLEGVTAFAVGDGSEVNNNFFGAVPSHPWLRDVIEALPESVRGHSKVPEQTGPGLLSSVTARHPEVAVFPWRYANAYDWYEPEPRGSTRGDGYAVHHWGSVGAEAAIARRETEALIPSGSRVLLLDGGWLPIELPAMQSVTRFWYRDKETWGGEPHIAQEVLDEFQRVRTPDLEWVAVLSWAFWWLDEYEPFFDYLTTISADVRRTEHVLAFRLAP